MRFLLLLLLSTSALSLHAAAPTYVGAATCADCHQQQYQDWRGSHHDLAMAEPTEDSVLGDFNDARFSAHGIESRFFRRNGQWWVNTDGPDGELHDYRIAYTFGWQPLQQYLIEFPGGRYQALGIAWDSRPASAGGQRWYHLYPEQAPDQATGHRMDATDRLHWTARDQTWNYQCAECHSTELAKNYDPDTDSYATDWAEINVACEACHGPASEHLNWAQLTASQRDSDADKGLTIKLGDPAAWTPDPDSGKPQRSPALPNDKAIEVCARCHSRRGQTWPDYQHGDTLDQSHRLALLEPNLYHVDGQIKDEVYVYGSFTQSAMYRAGVRCQDCHQSHSLKLRAQGNALCTRCHEAARFDAADHHHHPLDSTASACTACHMPETTYMGIDARADHSLRVPRPDLSLELGTPNACSACHSDQDASWAAAAVDRWFPASEHRGAHFAQTLHAARNATSPASDIGDRLLALAADDSAPAIARASAIEALANHADAGTLPSIGRLLEDPNPLIRREAVRLLATADMRTQVDLGWLLLDDPSRSVRLEAIRILAPLTRQGLPPRYRKQLNAAIDEYIRAQQTNAERPEAQLNLGLISASSNRPTLAEAAYRRALQLDASFTPAYVNLADLYRGLRRDDDGERVLRQGIAQAAAASEHHQAADHSEQAALHHALGLLLIRQQQRDAAIVELALAAKLAPQLPRYGYIHALALHSEGADAQAIAVLRDILQRHPAQPEVAALLEQLKTSAKE